MKEQLTRLGLTSLAAELPTVIEAARQQQLSYEAFLDQALAVEVIGRQRRAHARRMRAARLPFPARLETFDFRFQPTISERLIRELAGLSFVETATNVLLLGPPGVGKTHLACSLAVKALEAGHTALFTTLRELVAAIDQGGTRSVTAVVRRYSQPQVLVLDEVGYTPLTREHAYILFDIVSARYGQRPTVLTSNLSFGEWGRLLANEEVLASALLDRLLHAAEIISINGQSYRMRGRMEGDRRPKEAHADPDGKTKPE